MRPVSVVVASKVGPPFIDQCLASLKDEVIALGAEAIVVVAASGARVSRMSAAYPWARIIQRRTRYSAEPETPRCRGGYRGAGGHHRGALFGGNRLALARNRRSLERGVRGGGGAISDRDYERLRDWVVYFCEYNGALPPAPEGETADLNDANTPIAECADGPRPSAR